MIEFTMTLPEGDLVQWRQVASGVPRGVDVVNGVTREGGERATVHLQAEEELSAQAFVEWAIGLQMTSRLGGPLHLRRADREGVLTLDDPVGRYVREKNEIRRFSVYRTVGMFPRDLQRVCCGE
ncbi:MAG: hypothetical protein JXR77_17140 [Lentisphaeria bacterium]|nr:hypothetical protein [Lentisphaeria bacterium]